MANWAQNEVTLQPYEVAEKVGGRGVPGKEKDGWNCEIALPAFRPRTSLRQVTEQILRRIVPDRMCEIGET